MIEATTRVLVPLLLTALIAGALSACDLGGDGGADKAGGSDAPKVLRLAVADDAEQPDAPFARYFARRVAALSEGSLRVRVVWDAAGQSSPGYELDIARRVDDGDFELGWMGSRAWDRMGIKSFQALQAPFLVTDYRSLGRIATGPLAERMLAGLGRPRLRRARARARAPPLCLRRAGNACLGPGLRRRPRARAPLGGL